MDNLDGKVAVVTGAASGIGRAMAERFLSEGMAVVVADVEESGLKTTVEQLRSGGGDVEAVPTDVSDIASVQALAAAAKDRFGTFHVVCNNAGVGGHLGRVWETPLADYRWVIDVNLWGVIHGITTFVPTLVEQGEGHVVITSSLAGWSARPGLGPYAATKHAVLGLGESLRRELELTEADVGVSVLCPGLVNTNIMTSARNWPAALGTEPPTPTNPVSTAVIEGLTAGTTGGGADPSVAAEAVVHGILNKEFILTTDRELLVTAASMRLEVARTGLPVEAAANTVAGHPREIRT